MQRKFFILIYVLLLIILTSSACSKDNSSENNNPSPIPVLTISPNKSSQIIPSPTDIVDNVKLIPSPREVINNQAEFIPSPTEDAKDQTEIAATISSIKNNKGESSKIKGKIIAIDAGHQKKGNYDKEPIGPGAKETKTKVSSGTAGVATGIAEYELTLEVSLKVKDELINRGYEVVMIRETHDVNLSNKERAEIANESGADLFVRIHADSVTDSKVQGVSTLYPSKKNPYVSDLSSESYTLSKALADAICAQTGAKNRGAKARDDMSGINWCKIPVSIIEMGFMSNKKEDKLMQTEEYQDKIVKGICDGIDKYYEK